MAGTLALVFRSRLRLLPLALALAAAAMTFGALYLVGGDLTMASIAVLPVLIGLAVDYAIQFQARFDEQRVRGREGPDAAAAAAAAGGPTILSAGVATAVGFLVLLLSPVPMVRGFGALLVLGIGIALACAMFAGFAALSRFGGPRRSVAPPRSPARARASGPRRARTRARSPRKEWLADRSWRALGVALQRPKRVLAVGLAVAIVGLALDTQSEVVSDVRELVPSDLQELKDVNVLQEETGVSGEIDVTVRADDITDEKVDRLDDPLPGGRPAGSTATAPASAARRSATRPSCARPCRCPTCSRPRAPGRSRCASCSTPCRPTSRRASSRATARPPTSPSGSA